MSKKVAVPEKKVVSKSYLIPKVDETTGEEIFVPKFKYVIGSPKKYRFNGQNGYFILGKETILLDSNNIPITEFSFQPIAWRIFEENMFQRGRIDKWCEMFFLDDKKCISVIMFNNTTLQELVELAEFLLYEEITLADVVVTVKPEKVDSKKAGENKSWYIGRFKYKIADVEITAELQEFASDFHIYRHDTLTETANYLVQSKTFYLPPKGEVLQTEQVQEAA